METTKGSGKASVSAETEIRQNWAAGRRYFGRVDGNQSNFGYPGARRRRLYISSLGGIRKLGC